MTQKPSQKLSLDEFLGSVDKSLRKDLFSESYQISSQIGRGAFGKIYKVSPKEDPSRAYAAKVVPLSGGKPSDLEKEALVLRSMASEPGFPRMHSYTTESQYEILIMSLLGQNLASLQKQCEGKFSLKTVLVLAIQTLERIESLHKHGMLHRDIKPENLAMGSTQEDQNTLYLIDFGLAAPYLDIQGKHVPFCKKGSTAGTLYYLSVFGHLGIQASRRDDLISLGYVLIHFLKGSLPWANVSGDLHEKVKKIFQTKSTLSHEKLCEGLPGEFCEYFKYVSTLPFCQKPNYEYLEGLFKKMHNDLDCKENSGGDWMKLENKGIDLQGRKIMNEGLNIYMKNVEDSETFFSLELC